MKVLVISDVHSHIEDLRKVISLHHDMDLYLCLGDSEMKDISPFTSVKGNCDYFLDYPEFKDIDIPIGRMHLEHGIYGVSDERVRWCNCKIFLSGHTHRRDFHMVDDIYVFNPGSLSKPRDGHKSYLILDISKDKLDYKFYDLEN